MPQWGLCWLNKPNPKDYTPEDSIYKKCLSDKNYRNGQQISGCQGLRRWGRRKVGVAIKEPHKRSCSNGTALYLDCISVNILAVIFYQSFIRCYCGDKLHKEYTDSSCITSYYCVWIHNYLKRKSLKYMYSNFQINYAIKCWK